MKNVNLEIGIMYQPHHGFPHVIDLAYDEGSSPMIHMPQIPVDIRAQYYNPLHQTTHETEHPFLGQSSHITENATPRIRFHQGFSRGARPAPYQGNGTSLFILFSSFGCKTNGQSQIG